MEPARATPEPDGVAAPFEVALPRFEGPLDLLLFFIQRDELDVFDIPIARITDDFLAYTRALRAVDLDAAGEFVYFAALLISIKAKSLLPVPETDEAGEPVDPRRELVERLLDYVRFKEAAGHLAGFHAARAAHATRPADALADGAPAGPAPLAPGTPWTLVRALRRLLVVVPEPVQHAVRRVRVTVAEALGRLADALAAGGRVSFRAFTHAHDRSFVVAALLGVLEGTRAGALRLRPGLGADFLVERGEEPLALDPEA